MNHYSSKKEKDVESMIRPMDTGHLVKSCTNQEFNLSYKMNCMASEI